MRKALREEAFFRAEQRRYEMVEKAAEIYAYLKKVGNLIEDADILMAAIAVVEDLTLVTNNPNHFKRVEGLRLDNWLSN